jgi:hypothetical protein
MSKKIREFRFNEGLDGCVLAKSLKHATKLLLATGYYEGYTVKEVIEHCKDWDRNGYKAKLTDWEAEYRRHIKKGKYRKSKVLGWIPS